MPNMGGKTVLTNLGLNKEKQFFLSNPDYLQQFDALYVPQNLDLLKSYAVYQVYSGFALGMGLERVVMRRYNIDDIRLFYENDVRFLHQF